MDIKDSAAAGLFPCTICGRTLGPDHYYSKGTRRETRCKTCIRKIKKAAYDVKRKAKRVHQELIEDFTVTETIAAKPDTEATQEKLAELLRGFAMEVAEPGRTDIMRTTKAAVQKKAQTAKRG